jgi:hypothetical protein
MAAIGFDLLWVGTAAVVVLRGLLQPLPAPVCAVANPGPDRVPSLARLATWRDIGAGVGPLVAGLLLPVLPEWVLYGSGALLLAASTLPVWTQRPR